MNFVRERFTQFCIISFLITSGFGVLMTVFPRLTVKPLGIMVCNSFSTRVLGLILIVMGLTYVLALIYEEAKNPLLIIATLEKCLVVVYVLVAIYMSQVNIMALGMVAGDGAIALFGIMALRLPEDDNLY